MISVDQTSFLVIVAISALAGTATALAGKRSFIPVIVLEIVLGIIIGPQVLGLAHDDSFIDFFAELGLGMLFFFAGYEIDFKRIRGRPLGIAAVGWAMSLALAYAAGGLLASFGLVLSFLYVGSAMSTTALGTLIPILSDNGDSKTRFGTFLFGAGGARIAWVGALIPLCRFGDVHDRTWNLDSDSLRQWRFEDSLWHLPVRGRVDR